MIKLIMASGGIDSTIMIDEIMKKRTDDDIIEIHHVQMEYDLYPRNFVDYIAFKNVIKEFRKKYGEIKFTTSKFKMSPSAFKEQDIAIISFHAALKARDLMAQFFQIRNEWIESKIFIAFEAYSKESLKTIHETSKERRQQCQNIVNSLFNESKERGIPIPQIEWMFIDQTKEQVMRKLPEELKDVVNSCRYPSTIDDVIIPCGVCESCVLNQTTEKIINDDC